MSIKPSDVLFYGAGASLKKYGTLSRHTTVIARRGEEQHETFARTGTGTMVGGGGVIVSAAENLPRVNHYADGAVLSIPRLLLEDTRANGWTYSEQLDNAVWTKTNSTITANDETAPDDAATMDKIVEDATASAAHLIRRDTPALTDSTNQSVSFYAKADERNWVYVQTTDKANADETSWFNLTTGAEGTIDAGHAVNVEQVGSSIYRVEVIWGSAAGGTTPGVKFGLATQDAETNYNGDASSGLHVWGIQFETDKVTPSSYMQTVASTTTRSAESISFPFTAPPKAMTVYVKTIERGLINANGKQLFNIGSSSAAKLYVIVSSGNYSFAHDPGTGVTSTMAAAPSIGDEVELRGVLSADGSVQLHQSINGAAEVSATASGAMALAATWSAATIWLNSVSTSNVGFTEFEACIAAKGAPSVGDFRAILS